VLTTLVLRFNEIGTEGAVALAEMLKTNRVLAGLALQPNPIDDVGVKALLGMLKVNVDLTYLSLGYHKVADASLEEAVKAAVLENKDPDARAAKIGRLQLERRDDL
jgi:hypothetical protein